MARRWIAMKMTAGPLLKGHPFQAAYDLCLPDGAAGLMYVWKTEEAARST